MVYLQVSYAQLWFQAESRRFFAEGHASAQSFAMNYPKMRRCLLLSSLILTWLPLIGCGDFSNKVIEGLIEPQPTTDQSGPNIATPSELSPNVGALTVVPKSTTLPDARPGDPYAFQFSVLEKPSGPVCWKVTAGQLPPGLTLDRESGRLGGYVTPGEPGIFIFSVTAASPCDGASSLFSGTSQPFAVITTGRCQWDQDCAVNERCSADGVCRMDVASCPTPIGPTVRFEVDGETNNTGTLVALYGATVLHHGIADPVIAGCEPTDHLLQLMPKDESLPAGLSRSDRPISLCYRLPGETKLPVKLFEEIDIRFYLGVFGDRYAMLRPAGSTQGWRWALYSGSLDDAALWRSICGPHKDCPFVTKLTWVGLNGCTGAGACGAANLGVRVTTQSKVLLPGQQTTWGTGPDGAALYSMLLADAFLYRNCTAGSVNGGLTYLLMEGNMPHPLIQATKTEVFLANVPTALTANGQRSIGVAPKTNESSYIGQYAWDITVPAGNPRPTVLETSSYVEWNAYTVGEHIVQLGVFDYKTSQQSQHEAMVRISVRPQSAVHMELMWENPGENLNLKLLPAQALESWSHPKYPPLWENNSPPWANFEGKPAARIIAQPDGIPLELLQVDPNVIGIGKSIVAVEKTGGGNTPIRASLRLYLYGKHIDLPGLDGFLVRPGDFLPLVEWDIHNGTAARHQH